MKKIKQKIHKKKKRNSNKFCQVGRIWSKPARTKHDKHVGINGITERSVRKSKQNATKRDGTKRDELFDSGFHTSKRL